MEEYLLARALALQILGEAHHHLALLQLGLHLKMHSFHFPLAGTTDGVISVTAVQKINAFAFLFVLSYLFSCLFVFFVRGCASFCNDPCYV